MAAENDRNAAGTRPTSTIAVPTDVYERVERRLPRSEFETVDEYAAYVLEDVLGRVEDATDGEPTGVDREEVETRLEALGYLE